MIFGGDSVSGIRFPLSVLWRRYEEDFGVLYGKLNRSAEYYEDFRRSHGIERSGFLEGQDTSQISISINSDLVKCRSNEGDIVEDWVQMGGGSLRSGENIYSEDSNGGDTNQVRIFICLFLSRGEDLGRELNPSGSESEES
ncbi:unnamed protein product [Microthlaspi erraticum]|uniref:Uncharacterized protein n=1 Tax=Microthlaspi erraticum TaxID=1685480 RepID=A0A6D2J0F9_9BRAS|nr:unnamed protein product [Microthlaspi erraticum]